jgi:hypothetical protein
MNLGDHHRGGFPAEDCTMRFVVVTALMALTIIFGGSVSAGKKTPTNQEKIIGAWKLTKTTALVGSTFVFTFTNDGKFTLGNENAH